MEASKNNQVKVVKLLLDRGANIHALDRVRPSTILLIVINAYFALHVAWKPIVATSSMEWTCRS
jgi:hypothetical protein